MRIGCPSVIPPYISEEESKDKGVINLDEISYIDDHNNASDEINHRKIEVEYIGPIDNIRLLYRRAGSKEGEIIEEEYDLLKDETFVTSFKDNAYVTTLKENEVIESEKKDSSELLKASRSLGANYFGIAVGTVVLGLGFFSPILKGYEKDIVQILGSGLLSYNLVKTAKHSMMIKGLTTNNHNDVNLEEDEPVKKLARNK